VGAGVAQEVHNNAAAGALRPRVGLVRMQIESIMALNRVESGKEGATCSSDVWNVRSEL
jgi:hypothetical protein